MGKVVRKPEATTAIRTRDPMNSRLYRQIRYKGALTLIYELFYYRLKYKTKMVEYLTKNGCKKSLIISLFQIMKRLN